MNTPVRVMIAAALLIGATGVAADMLPLKKGIYVPVGSACKGASNAEMVNYWGAKTSIGSSQAECTIKRLVAKGQTFTIRDECRDIRSGESLGTSDRVLTIAASTRFRMDGTTYRYCGPRVQF